ncbi:Potassium voltage-gated channel subfamily H member 6 [Symbiodinium microadriaticum]|uniref:Potassium voltage-gated channel subfamily H member 6 n=1 Tax=Symbiodinium microadriaticum TaxID=2951 RepID=A0A1Q9D4W5_SYMMI|nr:Potassium voltage-gated channel subfamily H member 6 [Symbiodinium microadriaticum]
MVPEDDASKAAFQELLSKLESFNDEREKELARLRIEVTRYQAGDFSPTVPGERKSLEVDQVAFEGVSENETHPSSANDGGESWKRISSVQKAIAAGLSLRELWTSQNIGRSTAYLEEIKDEQLRAAASMSAQADSWEEQMVQKPAYGFIISPHGPKRVAWDFLSMLLLFYDVVTIPLTAFDPDPTTFTDVMDWITQIFWTCDIGMSLITGFVQEGTVNSKPWPIFINYLKTWFILDLLVCGPDWVFTIVNISGSQEATDPGSVNRLLRSLRVVRTVRLLRLVKLKRILAMIKDRITSEAVFILLNIIRMILMLLLVNHFIAATFYLIGSLGEPSHNWLDAYKMQKFDADLFFRYSTSLHWSLTQFTPASMDVHPQNVAERCFAIMVLIAGLVLFSSFISSITGSMSQLRNMQADRSKQFWLLRRYLKQQKVPMDLCFRVLRYTEYATSTSHDRVPEGRITILSSLTEQLRNELTFYTHYRNLKKHPVFLQVAGMNEAVLNRMSAQTLSSMDLAAGDPLFSLVDASKHMFFIETGAIRYTVHDRDTSKIRRTVADSQADADVDPNMSTALGKADYLCEVALWSSFQHVGVAQAMAEASVIRIEVLTFCELVHKDPELRELLSLYAHRFVEHMNEQSIEWVEVSSQESKRFTDDFFQAQFG